MVGTLLKLSESHRTPGWVGHRIQGSSLWTPAFYSKELNFYQLTQSSGPLGVCKPSLLKLWLLVKVCRLSGQTLSCCAAFSKSFNYSDAKGPFHMENIRMPGSKFTWWRDKVKPSQKFIPFLAQGAQET